MGDASQAKMAVYEERMAIALEKIADEFTRMREGLEASNQRVEAMISTWKEVSDAEVQPTTGPDSGLQ